MAEYVRRLVKDERIDWEGKEFDKQAAIVHDKHFVVRSVLGQVFVVPEEDNTLTHPYDHPKDQAEDLDDDRNDIELLLFTGIFNDFDEHADCASLENERSQGKEVCHIVANGEQDHLINRLQIIIDRCEPLRQLTDDKQCEHEPVKD